MPIHFTKLANCTVKTITQDGDIRFISGGSTYWVPDYAVAQPDPKSLRTGRTYDLLFHPAFAHHIQPVSTAPGITGNHADIPF